MTQILREGAVIVFMMVISIVAFAQTNYYVTVTPASLRSTPESAGEQIVLLSKYDNVIGTGIQEGDWTEVQCDKKQGYVLNSQIAKGKAIVTTYQQRTGATCKDGSHSSATGRGACSHHGGVLRWLYSEKQQVGIEH